MTRLAVLPTLKPLFEHSIQMLHGMASAPYADSAGTRNNKVSRATATTSTRVNNETLIEAVVFMGTSRLSAPHNYLPQLHQLGSMLADVSGQVYG